jgi:hypothetical protein
MPNGYTYVTEKSKEMEEYKQASEQWIKTQTLQVKFAELAVKHNKEMIEIHSEQLANNLKALKAEKELLRAGTKQYEDYINSL